MFLVLREKDETQMFETTDITKILQSDFFLIITFIRERSTLGMS